MTMWKHNQISLKLEKQERINKDKKDKNRTYGLLAASQIQ